MTLSRIYRASRMAARGLPFLVGLFVLPMKAVRGEGFQILQDADVQVYFEPPLKGSARTVSRMFPRIREELEALFRWRLNMRPSVLLIGKRAHFQSMAESPLTVAFAVPERELIVIDHTRMDMHPLSLETTMKHELCHLLLHRNLGEGRLPRWLDEGLCQWASGGIPDIVLAQKQSRLNRAALSGRYIPLRSLATGFPRESEGLSLAYEESESFVTFLVGKFGREGMLGMLRMMQQGADAETAVLNSFSVPLEVLEEEWQDSLRNRMSWFVYLSYHLYEILFGLMAVVTICAFVRLVLKKRALREEPVDHTPPRF